MGLSLSSRSESAQPRRFLLSPTRVLLRPFPYRDPQQLVSLQVKDQSKDYDGTLLRYELLRDRSQSFQSVAAWTNDTFNLTGHGEPMQVAVGRVSPNFFAMLGVEPQLGRGFAEEEGRPEGKPVVVLSDSLWRTRYGSDRNVVGQTITLDGTPHTVVGVLPATAQFPFVGEADVWTPRYFELTLIPPAEASAGRWLPGADRQAEAGRHRSVKLTRSSLS